MVVKVAFIGGLLVLVGSLVGLGFTLVEPADNGAHWAELRAFIAWTALACTATTWLLLLTLVHRVNLLVSVYRTGYRHGRCDSMKVLSELELYGRRDERRDAAS